MRPVWRWFGPDDPITLTQIRQAGASGIVTALHNRAPGTPWPTSEIAATKAMIEASGLTWDVCESIWMPDAIKLKGSGAKPEIDAWIETMRHLADAGIKTICYNFMPLLDWTRTDLDYPIAGRGRALRFDMIDFIVYDVHILARANAHTTYPDHLLLAARQRYAAMPITAQDRLEHTIIAGLPGSATGFTRDHLRDGIARFSQLSHDDLRANLASFLDAVIPVASALGINLAIHPDDPPVSLFGLARCVSTADDLRFIFASNPAPANGLTFCTGSLGVRHDNTLPDMAREFRDRIHFAHLRDIQREADGSFYEAAVFEGNSQIFEVVKELLHAPSTLPFRPDHGHLLDFEGSRKTNPGYSYLGRLKGLSELRGAILALSHQSRDLI